MIFSRKKDISDEMIEERLHKVDITCTKCGNVKNGWDIYNQLFVCPKCGHYMTVGAWERIYMVVDQNSFTPWFDKIEESNPLAVEGYPEKLNAAREKSRCSEAVLIGRAKIGGYDVVVGSCDANFMMGSMGAVMGERITRAFEEATKLRLPVFLFCCSGGARMQEGTISLMQMAKTAAAVKKHSAAGLFYCSILTDPTMGGVTASFATLGDVILAEPGARIGFAGPRVIQQTIGQKLADGFQTAEFGLKHGLIDDIVERKDLRYRLYHLARIHARSEEYAARAHADIPPKRTEESYAKVQKTPWEKIKLCRSCERSSMMDYVNCLFKEFYELHGDRYFGDDKAMVGGIALFGQQPVTVLGEMRGRNMQESIDRNFGMPKPEGYRKALRLMKQAEKFGRPIITFINTSGAFCGVDAEERGQGEAIARCIMEMSALKVPVLAILIGEGGSGGALATAVGNKVWMLENSTYAILSPEGYSSILYKTEDRAEEAAAVMKLTAQELLELKVIDRIIPELGGANQQTIGRITDHMKQCIEEFLEKYKSMTAAQIMEDRYQRFRKF